MSHAERASLEAVLEGVPLPATKQDLIKHVRADAGPKMADRLKPLSAQRYSSIDAVGEQLQPVQPTWRRTRRQPLPESDLPPGGAGYGATPA